MRRVVSERFPFVEVRWEARGQHGSALAFLDTRFDGFLILPADWLGQFGASGDAPSEKFISAHQKMCPP